MAAKKKSAIETRVGHPTGIVDDIIRPIVAKAARSIADRHGGKVGKIGKIADKMDAVADKSIMNRAGGYAKRGKTDKYNFIDNEVRVSGPKKSASKNYKKAAKAKNPYEKQMWKERAKVVSYNNIQKAKKK